MVEKTNKRKIINQGELLRKLETQLILGPVATCKILNTSYSTYKHWKSGTRNMTGASLRLVQIVMRMSKQGLDYSF